MAGRKRLTIQLKELSSPEETAERRGMTVGQMFGSKKED